MTMQKRIAVYLDTCPVYEATALKDFFDKSLPPATGSLLRGAKVFLKPNLLSGKRGGLACTEGRFLLALAEWLADQGAVVLVGDSPAFGRASAVLHALGIDEKLRRRGVGICDFQTVVVRRLGCGVDVGIAAEPLECDLFVNVPKLKAHSQMYVTMAVKNLFGIVCGMRKAMLHMRYGGPTNLFRKIIMDLEALLPANVSVIDGITAMHVQGPLTGEALALGCVGCSADPVALDTALLHALELRLENSPLWCEARERNYTGAELKKIDFPLLAPPVFHGSGFSAPSKLSPVRFNPGRFAGSTLRRCALYLRGK